MKCLNSNILRLTLVLAGIYSLVFAFSMAVPSIAAAVAHAKWLPGFVAGLGAGYLLEVPNRRERIYGVLIFGVLWAIGWTVFNALSIGDDASQVAVLLTAIIFVSLFSGLSTYLGLILGMHLAAPKVSDEDENEAVDAELRELVHGTEPNSEE